MVDEIRDEDQQAAQRLHARIVELARRHDHRRLLEITADPATDRLLALLPVDTRARSTLHLDAARRWSERQTTTNRRRLDEAAAALDALDIELASGLLARIATEFLSDDDRVRADDLLLRVTARRMELEQVEAAIRADTPPPPRRRPRRRWFRR